MPAALDAANSLFGTVHEDIEYSLEVTDIDGSLLRVASFTCVERLSKLFTYTIAVGTDPDPDSIAGLEEALGRDASFIVKQDGKVVRAIHGIVTDVIPDGAFIGKTQMRVSFVVQPRMANLCHSGGFRIFQDKAIHEIVREICEPEHVECLWNVHGTPPKRVYCTQLDESDFDFIVRLASEEGMHFFFQSDEQKTTAIFVNEPDGYEPIETDLELPFNDASGAVDGEHVRSIRRTKSIRTGAFEHRDYDFTKPKEVLLSRTETAGKETTGNSHRREIRDYPGRFNDKSEAGKKLAQRRLEELRSDAFVLTGSAVSQRFAAGKTFTLTGHREDGFNRKLLITSVAMDGAVQGARQDGSGFRGATKLVTFTAVPAEVPIYPRRVPKPASRLQSARVVGPKDGDPYVDEYGRFKVQFYWDRDGKFDEKSSCWVRTLTPVAHLDEGFWQAHKVGSEVAVSFFDDDIDRPVIIGAVYNAAQPQLYPLPSQVAKSTWRTNSIPGNNGFNEITQDNSAGREELFMHAQKNRRTVVLANHNETIGANQSSTVGANQTVTVGAARTVTVGAAHTVSVGANETNSVKGKRTETVDTGESVTIKAGRSHTISGGDTLGVTGKRGVTVSEADTLKAKSKEITIETTYDLNAGTSITIHHGGDSTLILKAGEATLNTSTKIVFSNPSGTVTLADNKVSIVAASEISLTAGAAKLSLKADGTVAMSGAKEVGVSCNAASVKLEPAMCTANAPAMNLTASGAMQVSGALVKIN
ncbi:type VI secretion system tip protein VgrG [Pendulispora brunnea]|uniref:Type VI secretion system tip protein VgrG n=1 Tax=Pendulispora brunnea TaxID=2905690 RepID=A0ABZ2K7F2_9BACT